MIDTNAANGDKISADTSRIAMISILDVEPQHQAQSRGAQVYAPRLVVRFPTVR